MSTKILEIIEKKHKETFAQIQNWFNTGQITQKTYAEMIIKNETIADNLSSALRNGLSLIEQGVLRDLSQILKYKRKPTNDSDAFAIMKEMIILGSENSFIRKTAAELAEKTSRDYSIPIPIPAVDRLYEELPISEDQKNTMAFINHCAIVAKEILTYIRRKSIYVADPPDDFYQAPFDTLGIMDLKGDCDDLAILLCSIYRSIGYRTYLGFLPKHVFAGVILAHPIHNEATKKNTIEYVAIPTDPQLEDFHIKIQDQIKAVNPIDLILDDSNSLTRGLIAQIRNTQKAEMANTQAVEPLLQSDRAKIEYLNQATIYFIDDQIGLTTNLLKQVSEAILKPTLEG